MTPDLWNLLNDAIRVGLFMSLIAVVIFLSYVIDLRLSPKPLRIEAGKGKKRRSGAKLEVVETRQTG